ncbi:hypothetical protein CBR_g37645 [Chara braunii]|uniref:Trichohyalin-plectin-homology domain-containing protein n=1 Tax=Chara braunii TaxID=69332 RepID=A0A388LNC0_CHABU|nr:hypothetical protein CBR_g37645 [Chara braunii]|eukprot:GBG83846.1 hypothetical protein CBR_g37645 [Chara braunii]
MKYQVKLGELAEKELQKKIQEQKKMMRSGLDQQVIELKERKKKEALADRIYSQYEARDFEKWRKDEEAKMEEKLKAEYELKDQRDQQLSEQAMGQIKVELEKLKEDRKRLKKAFAEAREQKQVEQKQKAVTKEFMDRVLESDMANRKFKAELKKKQNEEDKKRMHDFADIHYRQEMLRLEMRKAKSEEAKKRIESAAAAIAASQVYKELNEALVKKHFEARQKELEEREKQLKQRKEDLRVEMVNMLDKQLIEKRQL